MRGIKMLLQCSHIQQVRYHIISLSARFLLYLLLMQSCDQFSEYPPCGVGNTISSHIRCLICTFAIATLQFKQPILLSYPVFVREAGVEPALPCLSLALRSYPHGLGALHFLTFRIIQSWQNYNWCAVIPSRVRNAIANLY